MTAEELNSRLKNQEIVSLKADEWAEIADKFEEVERHRTFVADDLIIARGEAGLIAVEQPSYYERVVRPLPSEDEADKFVQERLDTYERMWNGCGCKINYRK